MKKRWMLILGSAVVLFGIYMFRVYPRHVALTLKGVQCKLGSSKESATPVTLAFHGTLERPWCGREKFYGTINISGATIPYRINGQYLTLAFTRKYGGEIIGNLPPHPFYIYGAIYPNRSFTKFAIQEWVPSGSSAGWSGANGLIIAAPAET